MRYSLSSGQSGRLADANETISSSVKELTKLLHLPAEVVSAIETAKHRDFNKREMVEKEAVALALSHIVEAAKAKNAAIRDAKKDARTASEEANALQSQLSTLEQLKAQVEQLKADNAKLLAEVKAAQTPVAAPVTAPVKPAGDQ